MADPNKLEPGKLYTKEELVALAGKLSARDLAEGPFRKLGRTRSMRYFVHVEGTPDPVLPVKEQPKHRRELARTKADAGLIMEHLETSDHLTKKDALTFLDGSTSRWTSAIRHLYAKKQVYATGRKRSTLWRKGTDPAVTLPEIAKSPEIKEAPVNEPAPTTAPPSAVDLLSLVEAQ